MGTSGACRQRRLHGILAVILLGTAAAASAQQVQLSNLWGVNGERWKPTGRLPDFSHAGYMAGERAIPSYPVQFDVVTDFGAKGDGIVDDSDAFARAIAAASAAAYNLTTRPCGTARCPVPHAGFQNAGRQGVAVLVPSGTYKITRMLEVTQSNVVVRGAGPDQTTLWMPLGLRQLYGDLAEWQWSGGFFNLLGPARNSTHTQFRLARLTADAKQGQRRLQVDTTQGLTVGTWVRLFAEKPLAVAPATQAGRRLLAGERRGGRQPLQALGGALGGAAPYLPLSDAVAAALQQAAGAGLGEHDEHVGADSSRPAAASAAGTLDAYLYGENAADSGSEPFPLERIRFASRVAAVGQGWVELARPLPHDLRVGWQVVLHSFQAEVQHSGWEGFTVHFQHAIYRSHFDVDGFNGFYASNVANCWVRNVRILNADTGGEAFSSDFVALRDIQLDVTAPRDGPGVQKDVHGHHGLWAALSSSVLITGFEFRTRFIHDLTLDVWAQECVVSSGKGRDVNLDMHRGDPHHNMWTNIDLGKASRPFVSSGNTIRGVHAARGNVWWNIFAASGVPLTLPPCDFGPLLTWVGRYQAPGGSTAFYQRYPGTCAAPPLAWYVEVPAPGAAFAPKDIHLSMLARRLAPRKQAAA